MTNEWFLEALIDVFVESERFLSDDNDLLLLSIVNCLELALVRPLCAQEYNERKNATAHPIEVILMHTKGIDYRSLAQVVLRT